MLTIPSTYQFTPKDLQGSGLAWKRVRVQGNAAQAAFSFLQTSDFGATDPDRVWLLEHAVAQGTCGGAQTFINAYFTENQADGTPVGLIAHLRGHELGPQIDGDQARIQYIVQPGNHIRAFATFSAGAAVNLIVLTVAGWLVPRANIEFAGSK